MVCDKPISKGSFCVEAVKANTMTSIAKVKNPARNASRNTAGNIMVVWETILSFVPPLQHPPKRLLGDASNLSRSASFG